MDIELDRLEKVMKGVEGYDTGDALLLHTAMVGGDVMRRLLKLKNAGLMAWDRQGRFLVSHKGVELFTEIYLAMTDGEADFSRFESLSRLLWDNYPDALQNATGRPLKCSVGDVAMRLRLLPPEYGIENYSDDEVLDALKRYVEATDPAFLVTLPDFVWQVRDGVPKSRLCDWLSTDNAPRKHKIEMLTL